MRLSDVILADLVFNRNKTPKQIPNPCYQIPNKLLTNH